ncbi:MAG: tetratricopeptide repeat protein [Isosphaeraceae bacterium]|nr:tetratricopeptide repeat protein [Isosphaeraceae bacterium]
MIAIGLILAAGPALAWADEPLKPQRARQLWQTGKYDEALEAYDAIAQQAGDDAATRAQVAVGRAEVLVSLGRYDEAIDAVKPLAEADPPHPDAAARLAEIAFQKGRWEEAEAAAKKALGKNPDHLLAHWVIARLSEAKGSAADEVIAQYEWFINYQNIHAGEVQKDAEALLLIGQAAERYYRAKARGEELANSLNEVINDIYEGALKADPKCWQAAWLEGRLFLSGYREGDARRELNRALLINPQAAEVLVTLGRADLQGYKLADGRKRAQEALEINPHYEPAFVLLADLNISDERFPEALEAAQKAAAENPNDEEALARLAAACRLLVNPAGAAAAEALALANNPRPATFYAALAERLADRRKYLAAEQAFLKAIEADPEHAEARIGLGMLYMQIGREDEALALFNAAFAADPFNVRADNMMKVLKRIAAYQEIRTEHYSLLVDPKQDGLHGKYMARYLESIYDELTKRFGYAPPGLTRIELLKDHETFSGRTTGLPFIPTVGACTGKVVALASPKAGRKPFNWSRVLVHEVTHVITLQQTEFNIPHWYTEALAVESERTPRPQPWNKMLLERIPARKLLNLDTINLGFIRPKEPEERQLAYAQAQLYAQYMVKRFGPEAQIKMLEVYRRGLTTDKAIPACFQVDKADFEAGYLKFLDEVVKTIRTRVDDEEKVPFSRLEQMLAKNPDDPDLNARMAYEHFARRDLKEARPYADKALRLKPHHPLASYVKARLLSFIGDDSAALAVLEPALDPERPNERVVDLLAELQMKAGKLAEAERLYELARKDDPYHSKWIAGLARVHLRQKDRKKLLADLAMLAANDVDDLDVRRTLAEYHLQDGNAEQAEKWATECLYIQVYDPALHALLADALAQQEKYERAIEEYQTALELKPKNAAALRVRLAKAQAASGHADEAKATLDAVLQADPGHPEAKALRETLK